MREIKVRHMLTLVYEREINLSNRIEAAMLVSLVFMILSSMILVLGNNEHGEKFIDTPGPHVQNLSTEPVLQNRF